ncbi:flagellar basal body rod protein FlgB [Evansella sp. AB-rgal1]|uniref:flagellar basal body rod protein FlgB n=1 Tax=Evansella sp. AB-rgal1 TaxID=3242696 RepID=UPI00359DABA8
MELLNNSTTRLLQTALNSSMVRQQAISHNIANIDTPNYKAKNVVFENELQQAVANQRVKAYRTDSRHLEFGGHLNNMGTRVTERNNSQYNHNGNNVDIDLEMAELAKNQIYYNALIDRLNGRFNSIRTVLGQGR